MNQKRKDYISWDEYFMGVSMLSGMRSKDPNTQVGACIVSNDNKILSIVITSYSIHYTKLYEVLTMKILWPRLMQMETI